MYVPGEQNVNEYALAYLSFFVLLFKLPVFARTPRVVIYFNFH